MSVSRRGGRLAGYLVRRVIGMIILLFLLTVTVFFLFSLLPGDPARLTCGKACSPEIVESNRHRLGLDEPVLVQYQKFLTGTVTLSHEDHIPLDSPLRVIQYINGKPTYFKTVTRDIVNEKLHARQPDAPTLP